MTDVRHALAAARARFARSPTPGLDAEVLLARALRRRRSWLHAWPEAGIDTTSLERFEDWVARRAVGEPVAYLIGEAEFWSLTLNVDPSVLIPRPETEDLVAAALAHLAERETRAPALLDLGTGSGCVAIALARERPDAAVTATEAVPEAFAVAQGNRDRHGLTNLTLAAGHWLNPVTDHRFEVIVCNPPYVRSDDPHLTTSEAGFEPLAALDGGRDGLAAIRKVVATAPSHIAPGGLLAIEHGWDQAREVVELARSTGLIDVAVRPDEAGLARVTVAKKSD
jgi:release factor glutamine methyltransferase